MTPDDLRRIADGLATTGDGRDAECQWLYDAAKAWEGDMAALKALHDDIAEYARLNNIGGFDNHAMVNARAAIDARTPPVDVDRFSTRDTWRERRAAKQATCRHQYSDLGYCIDCGRRVI